jgi:hypothetical protein
VNRGQSIPGRSESGREGLPVKGVLLEEKWTSVVAATAEGQRPEPMSSEEAVPGQAD